MTHLDRLRKMARFPEGKSVDVPKYLRDHGNPEGADEWEEMNEKYKGLLKKEGEEAEAGQKKKAPW